MRSRPFHYALVTISAGLAACATAQPAPESAAASSLTYADVVDLALAAPIVAVAEIDRAVRLDDEQAVGTPPGHVRYYVEAELGALIRSGAPVPSAVRYLIDMPLEADGDRPRIEGRTVILMVRPAQGRPGEVVLAARDAQLDWSPALEQQVRAILTEAAAANPPPIVTGVANAFSVPGALPGESETQIFLSTADGRPVSLGVLRRPGEDPRWSISLGEIVESTMRPPEPNTLLWYRLACALPESLPQNVMERGNEANYRIAEADYRFVLDELGRCERTRSAG